MLKQPSLSDLLHLRDASQKGSIFDFVHLLDFRFRVIFISSSFFVLSFSMTFSRTSVESTLLENKRLQGEVVRLRLHLEAANSHATGVEHHETRLRTQRQRLSFVLDGLRAVQDARVPGRRRLAALRTEVTMQQKRLQLYREETRLTELYIQMRGVVQGGHVDVVPEAEAALPPGLGDGCLEVHDGRAGDVMLISRRDATAAMDDEYDEDDEEIAAMEGNIAALATATQAVVAEDVALEALLTELQRRGVRQ